jgi:hypothetical protein
MSPFVLSFDAFKVRVRHEVKNGNNTKYRPGLYDTVVDVCEIANGFSSPILNVVFPNLRERLAPILHACPYDAVRNRYYFQMDR